MKKIQFQVEGPKIAPTGQAAVIHFMTEVNSNEIKRKIIQAEN